MPLRYVRQNLLIGRGGDAAAIYRLPTIAYAFLPVSEKVRWLHRMEHLASTIGVDFSILRVNRAYPADDYLRDTMVLLDRGHQSEKHFADLLHHHESRLHALASHVPEVYLVASLPDDENGGAGFGRAIDRTRRRLEDLAGVAAPQPISRRELRALTTVEQRTHHLVHGAIDARRATTREIEWLLRRSVYRGLAEPITEQCWTTPDALIIDADDPDRVAYEPLTHDLRRLVNAPITEPRSAPARLVIETEHGDSHQALLALGTLPDTAVFPGALAELLYGPLEGVAYPVDAVAHVEWIGNRQALGQVRRRITDVEQVYRDQTEGTHGPGFLAEEDRVLAREYEATLQGSAHPPMLRASISLAVGAPDADELERRVATLREQFGVVRMHRPRGLQEALFMDHLPRADGGRVRDYTEQMTVEQFGAMMPVATQQVGADRGIYLGISGGAGGRPVRYDPTAPSRQSRASAVLLAGTLGSGKTLAAQLIALHAERRGSLVVDIDPKPDHALHKLPELAGRVDVLELSGNAEHRGALDPLAIGLPDLREELASSYYLDLLRDPPASWEHQIQRAVRDAVHAGATTSTDVLDRLRAAAADGSPAAGEVADALGIVADFGLARLGFAGGRSSVDTPEVNEAPVTTIRTPGLTLPDPRAARETYTRSERISVATLALVAAYALRLVSRDRSRHKVVVLDEAWFLLSSSQGRSLIDRLVRLGRAYNATILLATQRLEDLGDLGDLVGTYFIFGQESEIEARRALELLGLDPDDAGLVARVRQYRRGRCLMRDLDGRVGEVQIDPAVPGLLDALDTTPTAATQKTGDPA